MGWIALSDGPSAAWVDWRRAERAPGPLAAGTLALEIVQPRPGPAEAVLLRRRFAEGRGLRLSLGADGGLALTHRGTGASQLRLDRALGPASRRLRLGYSWDLRGGHSRLWAEDMDGGTLADIRGHGAVALSLEEAQGLMTPGAQRDAAVLWHGLSLRAEPPRVDHAVGAQTPVATTAGPMPACRLAPGMRILTADNGPQVLLATATRRVPARGGRAPVCLRAPYFARSRDLIVSACQGIVIGGAEVEYLFGEDQVVVQARDLVSSDHAYAVSHVPFVAVTELLFERPQIIFADGQPVSAAGPAERRVLRGYEAATLRHFRSQGFGTGQ